MEKHGDIGHIADNNSNPIPLKDFSNHSLSEYPLTQGDCVEDCVEDCKDEPDTEQCTEQCTDSCEMPRYKCIKDVWALKIKSIVFDSDLAAQSGRETDGSATFTPEDDCYAPIKLSAEYVHKHKPVEGGYYVVYKDGYKSFSPASAFEEGYVLIQ